MHNLAGFYTYLLYNVATCGSAHHFYVCDHQVFFVQSANEYKNIEKSFLSSLSATVTIACLFIPKLYIILLHPEKNVRQSMMNHSKYQSTHHQSIKANGPASLNGGGPTSLSQKCNGMYRRTMYTVFESLILYPTCIALATISKNVRKEKETKQISRIRHLR